MTFNRRDFIKIASAAAASQVLIRFPFTLFGPYSATSAEAAQGLTTTAKWGMLIDLDKCIGCMQCTRACKEENGTPPGIDWNIVRKSEEDQYPNVAGAFLPLPCMHCEDPPCVEVCPAKATYQRADGLVVQDYKRCIGCRYCQTACPYGRRYFNWQEPDNSKRNPAVEPRTRGVVEKCTFCIHRIDQALQAGFVPGIDAEATPACVNVCPPRARAFGNLNDAEGPLAKLIAGKKARPLKEYLGTRPQVYYGAPRDGGEWTGRSK